MTVLGERWLRRWGAPALRVFLLAFTVALGVASIPAEPPADADDLWRELWIATGILSATTLITSVRPRGRIFAVSQPLIEAAAVGVVLAQFSSTISGFYSLFLFTATFVAGQRVGILGALVVVALGGTWWVLGEVEEAANSDQASSALVSPAGAAVLTIGALIAISMLSEWIRRLRNERVTTDRSAYADAFRLLSELQHVARNLSLGLDPATLAGALVDDLAVAAPGTRVSVAVRGPEGRFSPLVGALDDEDHAMASEAWLAAQPMRRRSAEGERQAVPVRMGERVLAMATLQGPAPGEGQEERIAAVVRDAGPRLAAALLFDQVRQLATNDERLRLAREIHDGIAQELASIGYMLDDVATRVPPAAADDLTALRDHVRKVTGELRLSIFDLRAGVDDKVTLGAALAEHVQRVAAASRVVAHTSIDEQGDRLSSSIEIELLRIAQEALTNVRKHARAGQVWIHCTIDAPRAYLMVADDGIGLQAARPGAMGLQGMRERARRIGGVLDVRGRDGGGTIVEVRLGTSVSSRPERPLEGLSRGESIA